MKNGLVICCICLALASCAKMVTPDGGAIDRTAPKQTECIPAQNSLGFKSDNFVVEFDEYIVLDNVSQKLLVSPPLKTKPEISAKLNRLYVKGLDSLAENTTYIFDFADAIRDFNEGNRLSNFKYAFSTGNAIDTLYYAGRVLEAYSLKGVAEKYVLLYSDTILANIYDKPCDYITRTDSTGGFVFSNLADKKYRILVLDDKNQNQRYDLPTEGVGFSEFTVTPYALDSASLANAQYNMVYYEDAKQETQSIIRTWFSDKGVFNIAFALPVYEKFTWKLIKPESKGEVLEEFSPNLDTLRFYSTSPTGFDSIILNIEQGDFKEEIVAGRKASKRKSEEGECFSFGSLAKDTLHFFNRTCLSSTLPLADHKFNARLVKENDTMIVEILRAENLNDFYISEDLEKGRNYTLIIDSAAIKDISGRVNCGFETEFYLSKEADYGSISLSYQDSNHIDTPHIFVLCDLSGKELKQMPQKSGSGQVVFDNLRQGKYRIKVVVDKNGDRKWTGADFSKSKGAERVMWFEKILSVRSSWEVEEQWIIFP